MPSPTIPFPGDSSSSWQRPRASLPPRPARHAARHAAGHAAAGGARCASGRATARRRHHPRPLAALCYTVPILPAGMILMRERTNRFLRFHAAQALVFHALIAAGQIAVYVLLLVAGGLIHDEPTALVAAGLIVVLFLSLGITALVVWLGLIADCMRGEAHALPVAGAWAVRLERFSPRGLWARWWMRWRRGAA